MSAQICVPPWLGRGSQASQSDAALVPLAPSRRIAKRCLDVTLAGAALLLTLPLLLLVAAAIKLLDDGPVLFWQQRVGLHGKTFWFPKFRSMVPHAESLQPHLVPHNLHGDSITFKLRRDPRVTPLGRLLRRFSLDELPQLGCVLLGHMSLVGPRPAVPQEVARYSEDDRQRLASLPGLTCLWQVSGRSDLPFHRQVELDKQYLEQQSLGLDLRLILKTIPAVLAGRGAY